MSIRAIYEGDSCECLISTKKYGSTKNKTQFDAWKAERVLERHAISKYFGTDICGCDLDGSICPTVRPWIEMRLSAVESVAI
jgi:hypothetical protein